MTIRPLTIGFVIDEKNGLPTWELLSLQELIRSEFISSITLIILPEQDQKPRRNEESFGLVCFKKFENVWFKNKQDAALVVNLDAIHDPFRKLKSIKINMDSPTLPPEVDLLYLCYKLRDVSIFNPPIYGIWKVVFGKNNAEGNLPGFWEVMNRESITESRLVIQISENSSVVIACHSIASTISFSVKNNFNSIALKTSHYLLQRVRELYLTDKATFFSKRLKFSFEPNANINIRSREPGSLKMLCLFLRNIYFYLLYKISKFSGKEIFMLFYAFGKLDIHSIDFKKYSRLQPPPKKFWADPFVIHKGQEHFIFFEEGYYPGGKGRIAVMKIDIEGKCSERKIIIEEPYHLSYPFVLEIDGNYYIIPESSANKTVDVYHCEEFPYKWKFYRRLLNNIVLQDSTLFHHGDIWWLFATTKDPLEYTSNDQLMIYYSSDIFSGEWHSHPCNPVITDVSNCRPAGKIFVQDKRIFRPAQNNSCGQYGYSIRINEIEILTKTEYREKMINEISPLKFPTFAAMHTINADGNMIVIDGIMS